MSLTSFSANTVIKSADVNDNFTHLADGTYDVTANSLVTAKNEAFQNYIVSGCVWSITSGLVGAMTSGVVQINGKRLTVAAVASKSYSGPLDYYVDLLDNSDGTATVVYNSVANNAASQALASNSVRNAIIVTTNMNITVINQGDPTTTGPTVSSNVLTVTDSLGNLINPRNPNPGLISYRSITVSSGNTSASAADVDIVGLDLLPVIVPANRLVKLTALVNFEGTASALCEAVIKEGSTQIARIRQVVIGTGGWGTATVVEAIIKPTSGLHTYKFSHQRAAGSGTNIVSTYGSTPIFLKAELL